MRRAVAGAVVALAAAAVGAAVWLGPGPDVLDAPGRKTGTDATTSPGTRPTPLAGATRETGTRPAPPATTAQAAVADAPRAASAANPEGLVEDVSRQPTNDELTALLEALENEPAPGKRMAILLRLSLRLHDARVAEAFIREIGKHERAGNQQFVIRTLAQGLLAGARHPGIPGALADAIVTETDPQLRRAYLGFVLELTPLDWNVDALTAVYQDLFPRLEREFRLALATGLLGSEHWHPMTFDLPGVRPKMQAVLRVARSGETDPGVLAALDAALARWEQPPAPPRVVPPGTPWERLQGPQGPRLTSEEITEFMRVYDTDAEPRRRGQALEFLSRVDHGEDPRIAEFFARVVRSESAHERQVAFMRLWWFRSTGCARPEIVPGLVDAVLRERDAKARAGFIGLLGGLLPSAEAPDNARIFRGILEHAGAEAGRELLRQLRAEDAYTAMFAVLPDARVRMLAILREARAREGDPDVVGALDATIAKLQADADAVR